MRIFHGLNNIAGIPATMAKAERALGFDSTSVCYPSGYTNYAADIIEEPTFESSVYFDRFERCAEAYDVFVFHFGQTLIHESLMDIPVLKQMGKTVIFYFHGCDIRQSKDMIQKYKFSSCMECWPHLCNSNRDLVRDMAAKYADRVWVSTPDLLEFAPKSELFPQPIDLAKFANEDRIVSPVNENEERCFQIVHAPTDTRHKGTRFVLSAIDQLQQEGLPIELLLLQGLTHAEVLAKMRRADLAIDQLLAGSYGVLSIEFMALGVPTICYLRDDLIAHYPEKPPLRIADPETIASVIRAMVSGFGDWKNLVDAGRAYVKKYHDAPVAAQRSVAAYRSIRGG